jgi:hypothetical protein
MAAGSAPLRQKKKGVESELQRFRTCNRNQLDARASFLVYPAASVRWFSRTR